MPSALSCPHLNPFCGETRHTRACLVASAHYYERPIGFSGLTPPETNPQHDGCRATQILMPFFNVMIKPRWESVIPSFGDAFFQLLTHELSRLSLCGGYVAACGWKHWPHADCPLDVFSAVEKPFLPPPSGARLPRHWPQNNFLSTYANYVVRRQQIDWNDLTEQERPRDPTMFLPVIWYAETGKNIVAHLQQRQLTGRGPRFMRRRDLSSVPVKPPLAPKEDTAWDLPAAPAFQRFYVGRGKIFPQPLFHGIACCDTPPVYIRRPASRTYQSSSEEEDENPLFSSSSPLPLVTEL